MDIEIGAAEKKNRLNSMVAITVVILSVFMAICKIKDDNMVQAMQQAKSDAVDSWSQYQSKKIKLHLAESSLRMANLLATTGMARAQTLEAEQKLLAAEIARYEKEGLAIEAQARAHEAEYDALNFHDDQFDMSDAALSIALAVAAVAALTDKWALLFFSWGSGSFGVLFGLAGFFGWRLHPGWLVSLLT
ncbi:MAG: DUF4337 domain-containing protein [bacterium]|nr:DUF4337 domain-containing protein [bacterium]